MYIPHFLRLNMIVPAHSLELVRCESLSQKTIIDVGQVHKYTCMVTSSWPGSAETQGNFPS
jgi:hypothetical protein